MTPLFLLQCILAIAPLSAAQILPKPDLGAALPYGILGEVSISNTGPSVITGNVGIGGAITSVTGFPPGIITGSVNALLDDPPMNDALIDAEAAYTSISLKSGFENLSGQDLGNMILSPGVYRFTDSAQLTGLLTLMGSGSPDDAWYFQIGSTLTTAIASSVILDGGALACNVFWQVGSSATIGIATDFAGSIIAYTSLTMVLGSTLNGRGIALHGSVVLDTNEVIVPQCNAPPSTSGTALASSNPSLSIAPASTFPDPPAPPASTTLIGTPPPTPGISLTSDTEAASTIEYPTEPSTLVGTSLTTSDTALASFTSSLITAQASTFPNPPAPPASTTLIDTPPSSPGISPTSDAGAVSTIEYSVESATIVGESLSIESTMMASESSFSSLLSSSGIISTSGAGAVSTLEYSMELSTLVGRSLTIESTTMASSSSFFSLTSFSVSSPSTYQIDLTSTTPLLASASSPTSFLVSLSSTYQIDLTSTTPSLAFAFSPTSFSVSTPSTYQIDLTSTTPSLTSAFSPTSSSLVSSSSTYQIDLSSALSSLVFVSSSTSSPVSLSTIYQIDLTSITPSLASVSSLATPTCSDSTPLDTPTRSQSPDIGAGAIIGDLPKVMSAAAAQVPTITVLATVLSTLTSCPGRTICTGQTTTYTGTHGPLPCATLSTCSCVLPGGTQTVTICPTSCTCRGQTTRWTSDEGPTSCAAGVTCNWVLPSVTVQNGGVGVVTSAVVATAVAAGSEAGGEGSNSVDVPTPLAAGSEAGGEISRGVDVPTSLAAGSEAGVEVGATATGTSTVLTSGAESHRSSFMVVAFGIGIALLAAL